MYLSGKHAWGIKLEVKENVRKQEAVSPAVRSDNGTGYDDSSEYNRRSW